MVLLTRLKELRERRALSQGELAERAGISRVALLRIEKGQAEPHPRTTRRLAEALGVEPGELMEPRE